MLQLNWVALKLLMPNEHLLLKHQEFSRFIKYIDKSNLYEDLEKHAEQSTSHSYLIVNLANWTLIDKVSALNKVHIVFVQCSH